ncbi:MAG: aminodeoxychorismate synthase component I, partial [Opitutales bacterium]
MRVETITWADDAGRLVAAVAAQPGGWVLESSRRGHGLGRFSFLGWKPQATLRAAEGGVILSDAAGTHALARSPLQALEEVADACALPADAPAPPVPFAGGWVGFLGYELIGHWERLDLRHAEPRRLPEMEFRLFDGVLALDHENGALHAVAQPWRRPEDEVMAELLALVKDARAAPAPALPAAPRVLSRESNFSRESFVAAAGRVRDYIRDGEVYQVNLAQRFSLELEAADPVALYLRLRALNPSPYAAFLPVEGGHLLSMSPEQLLCRRGERLASRPIKGTRPRGRDAAEDAALREALVASAKDRAELLMIVDLVRNDLGRIAWPGSVTVPQLFSLETYPTVFHQTAVVEARRDPACGLAACLEAVFPGGSITGAPKLRAMEIIHELEGVPREAYTGAIGYVGAGGDFEFNIAIRTASLRENTLLYHAGGGIVWDSDPAAEF